ncbi:LytR family transcriptional regulator [Halalkalibacter alkalisediminis]|uniref:LytR family transcriptional regulator n=1 Tax=Halalkalibacter alkalisediminis TaxID=935616 RepID=A0ABV6NJB4_9BACI|nr:LytR family transcriptional regulator [Halalkalibacter alkalisediminis]
MKQIDRMPKSIVKALRYIKQDGPKDKLDTIQQLLQQAIEIRKQEGTR